MSSVRANNVYLGLPAVIIAMGEKGAQVASIYLAVVLPGYNILSVVWGELLKSGTLNFRIIRNALLNLTKNPLIISSISGVICGILGLPIPESLMVSMKFVGDMATGLALITLGMSLELQNLPSALKRTWSDVLIKLIVHPAFAWLFLLIWPVEKPMFQAVVIICAMPTAVNTFMVAEAMGLDHEYACELVAVTTTLAAVTIPVWVMLLGL